MKIFRINFLTADEGMVIGWARSKVEARRKRTELIHDFGEAQGVDSIDEIELATDKSSLLRWLNANFTRDNG